MAVRTLREAGAGEAAEPARTGLSLGGVALALAVPLIFLHIDFQPTVTVTLGSTPVTGDLSDAAVLALAAAGLASGLGGGFGPLRAGLIAWLAAGAFLTMVVAASFYPLLGDETYHWRSHLVTAAKFVEYGLLVLAVPLLVRRRDAVELLCLAVAAWSVAATVVGLVQFFGWGILDGWPAGRRQPSFLGHHDFAALSGASLSIALLAIALGPGWRASRPVALAGGIAGAVGLVLSGSTAGAIGLAAATVAAALVAHRRAGISRRRLSALAAISGIVVGGVLLQRGGDFDQLFRALGLRHKQEDVGVQTYVQHTLLVYIGWRIFLDNPLAGAGWQASTKEPATYRPYLDDARREFPSAPAIAFPSPAHPWGVQNAYVQALADLGVIGLLLFLGVFVAGLGLAARIALRGPPEVAGITLLAGMWLLVVMGVWSALGLVAGLPLDALTWIAIGLVVATAGMERHVRVR